MEKNVKYHLTNHKNNFDDKSLSYINVIKNVIISSAEEEKIFRKSNAK